MCRWNGTALQWGDCRWISSALAPPTPHAPLAPRSQVFSLFLPDVNIRRKAAWYKDGDPEDLSLDDSQVRGLALSMLMCACVGRTILAC